MTRHESTSDAFTLIETLMAGSILIVIAALAVLWLNSTFDFSVTTTAQSHARETVQLTIARMAAELKSATRTGVPNPPALSIPPVPNNTQVTFYVPADLDGNGTVIDVNGNIEWNVAQPVQYVYDAPSQQLRRIQNGQTTILTAGVTAARFDDVTTDATLLTNEVKITLTLQVLTPRGRTVSATSIERVKVRN